MTTNEKIAALRNLMKERKIDVYIVPTSDFHTSEYVGEYFKERSFLTGFTGSAGTAIITMDEACLWADGRYFIQAANQIADSEIILQRMGEPNVPTEEEYVKKVLPENGVIGFDGRCVCVKSADAYLEIANEKNGALYTTDDLVGMLWENRPALPYGKIWVVADEYSGKTYQEKLAEVRKEMEEKKAEGFLLSSLYDIAWFLNMRGDDISHVPVFLSFLYVGKEDVTLFVDEKSLCEEVCAYLSNNNIKVEPYGNIYAAIKNIKEASVLVDEAIVNYNMIDAMPENVDIIKDTNPTELMKAVKNEVELKNTRIAHIKDGVAMTKFMYYIKTRIGKEEMSELSVSDYLEKLRREQGAFDLSFDTISAYGPNAAMMHYAPKPESNAKLQPEGFLLVDSGGHYLEGTTDITRTYALGPITDKMRTYYTTVLRSNLRLALAKFPDGTTGQNLDVLSRGPVWDLGLDYRCGTGHGVGHILNVHEGPNGFRFRMTKGMEVYPLKPGNITTDEPGLYMEGEFGIRIENELICVLDEKTEYGQFLSFENITMAPIDLDCIDAAMLLEPERAELNRYHKQVFDTISPYLTAEEKEWLAEYTKAV